MQTAVFMHALWRHAFLDHAMIACAQYGLVISVIATIAGFVRRRSYGLLVWLLPAALASAALSLLAGRLFFDARPFVALHVTPLVAHGSDNGFPSDHSTVAAFLAAALWFVDRPMAVLAVLVAFAIGIARVYCLLHTPLDIGAGWCIGALPALGAALWWRRRISG